MIDRHLVASLIYHLDENLLLSFFPAFEIELAEGQYIPRAT